jgi:hypothetical protein
MKQKFVEVEWDKEFPPQKPNISFAQSSQKDTLI